jgi:hypothetical protein
MKSTLLKHTTLFITLISLLNLVSCRGYENVNIAKELFSKKLKQNEEVVYDFSGVKIIPSGINFREFMTEGDIIQTLSNAINRDGKSFQIIPQIRTANGNDNYVVIFSRIFLSASNTNNTSGNRVYSIRSTVSIISKKHNKTYSKRFSISLSKNQGTNTPIIIHRNAFNELLDGLGERVVIWTNNRLYKLNK